MATFTKRRSNAPTGFFRIEAAGLRWLAEPGAVRVAGVIDVGEEHIEIERLESAPATAEHADAFGRDLARLHDAGAAAFGCPPEGWTGDGFIGDAPLPLRTEPAWGAFYARHRVTPYLRSARDAGDLTSAQAKPIEAVCERLEAGDFDDAAPPARIHGDLWSGNLLWTPTGAALIDPAAHGGHRVTDLAMLELFGAPQLGRITASYAEASEHLPEAWRSLIPLHQLHPLLVHTVLFGGSYAASASEAAVSALRL